jgi:DNA-binding NarL/FixJ family response regulator
VTVRLLLVDDSEHVREGLRMVFDAEPEIEVVGEAADGVAGVAEAERLRPDVVLTDVRMPGLDGIEATRRIVALDGRQIRVLMLTTFDLGEYLLEALRAGVSGFALKDTPPDELVDGVLAVARDDALVDARATVELIEAFVRDRPPATDLDALSDEQRTALALVGRGRSNAEIAAELGLAEPAVAEIIAGIEAALGVRDRIHAAVVARALL